jgi:DNA polymerase III delta prime subunit
MPFSDILGQQPALETLYRALDTGHVHHAYRFEGPEGVGKEMAAFCLAQALVCEQPSEPRRACGKCSACLRAYFAQTLAITGRDRVASAISEAERCALRHNVVLCAMRDVEHNVSPALVVESMLYRLRQL